MSSENVPNSQKLSPPDKISTPSRSDVIASEKREENIITRCLHQGFAEACLPAFCHQGKWPKCRKVTKYVYVVGVIVLGFLLSAITQFSDPIDEWVDGYQAEVLYFLIEDHWIYICLVLTLITALKAVGVKDVLGLRTISVVILSYRICPNPPGLTLIISMSIIGVLSSVSKLIEYQVIGHELQVVQGTPVEFVFKYARKVIMFCMKGTPQEKETKLEWFDPKWTWEISEVSREDKTMNIMNNYELVIQDLVAQWSCCKKCIEQDIDIEKDNNDDINGSIDIIKRRKTTMDRIEKQNKRVRYAWKTFYFIIAVIWTSTVEWIQPITELFLFAHNWDLSYINAAIICLSEFADFDKMVEAMFLINALNDDSDIVQAKVEALLSKAGFWAIGYCVIMPPSLFWAYRYHKLNKDKIEKKRIELGLEAAENNNSSSSDVYIPDASNTETTTITDTAHQNGSTGSIGNGYP